MEKKETIFTKIASREIPANFVYEDKQFMAILDISRFVPGHTIVIPKFPYEFIWDMPGDILSKYWSVIYKVANHYRKNLGYQYVDTMTLGRLVPHTHVHLIPHNGENRDYEDSLEEIGAMQQDESRRLGKKESELEAEKFRLPE